MNGKTFLWLLISLIPVIGIIWLYRVSQLIVKDEEKVKSLEERVKELERKSVKPEPVRRPKKKPNKIEKTTEDTTEINGFEMLSSS